MTTADETHEFTDQELQIIFGVCSGLPMKEITQQYKMGLISTFDKAGLSNRLELVEFVKAALNGELRRRQKRDEQLADANLLVLRDTQRQLAKAAEREREWALAIVYAGIERFPHKKIMAEAEAVLDERRKLQEEYARTHGGKATIETMENFLKSMRQWWSACKNSEQRAGALRMYVGPTIDTANGIKEIWEIAQVASFDDLDDITIKVLKEHADRIPNFLD